MWEIADARRGIKFRRRYLAFQKRLIAIQAEGSSAIMTVFASGGRGRDVDIGCRTAMGKGRNSPFVRNRAFTYPLTRSRSSRLPQVSRDTGHFR